MIVAKIVMFIASIISFISFFYLGVSQGQGMDASDLDKKDINYKGGIAGIIISIIIFFIGVYLNARYV